MKQKNGTRERVVTWGSLVAAGILAGVGVKYFDQIEVWTRTAGGWAPLVYMLLYVPLSLTPIPSDPLTVLNGGLFGPVEGIIVSWMGNNLAAITEYWVFRRVSGATKFAETKNRLPKWLRRWPVGSPLFLIGARFLPGFGGKIVSVMAGMYQVPTWRFVWTAVTSNLAGSALVALGGWGLLKLI